MPTQGPLLDSAQVLPRIYDPATNTIQVEIPSSAPIPITVPPGQNIPVTVLNSLVPEVYDSIALTYWTSGNGIGQIETVQYYVGGLGGTLVATLTLNYNANAQISSVVRT
jgi:hypothetical protein